MTKEEAVEKIKLQIEKIPGLKHTPAFHSDYEIWEKVTKDFIKIAFDDDYVKLFIDAKGHMVIAMDKNSLYHNFIQAIEGRQAFLNSLIREHEELKDDLPVSFKKISLRDYDLHHAIKRVSGKLFEDGHYKDAILAAYIEVIDRVKCVAKHPKNASGVEMDGENLMNHVFNVDTPLLKLNEMSSVPDKDEQKGFMYLFKGICGLRNEKGHRNFVQNNPKRTVEHLALASLLMGVLDDEFIKTYNGGD
jgi:uncharacterized protein (TIGR02391 family)